MDHGQKCLKLGGGKLIIVFRKVTKVHGNLEMHILGCYARLTESGTLEMELGGLCFSPFGYSDVH